MASVNVLEPKTGQVHELAKAFQPKHQATCVMPRHRKRDRFAHTLQQVNTAVHRARAFCRWYPEKVLLDPYAPLIAGRQRFAQRDEVEQFQEKVGGPMRMWLVAESVPEGNCMDTAKNSDANQQCCLLLCDGHACQTYCSPQLCCQGCPCAANTSSKKLCLGCLISCCLIC